MRLQTLRDEILSRRDEIAAPSADRMHWDDTLRAIFTGYTLVNWTDFNYGKCHTYEILMPRGSTASPGSFEDEQQLLRALGGSRASLLLKLSVVAPYYLLCVVVRDIDARDESVRERYVQPRGAEERELWARAVGFAEQHGFSAIDLESLSAQPPLGIPESRPMMPSPSRQSAWVTARAPGASSPRAATRRPGQRQRRRREPRAEGRLLVE